MVPVVGQAFAPHFHLTDIFAVIGIGGLVGCGLFVAAQEVAACCRCTIPDLKECSSMSMETNHPPAHGQGSGAGAGYEQRDANIPDLLKFGFWMALVIAVTLVAMKWTFNYFRTNPAVASPATPFARPRELPPSPRLQAEPHVELKDYCEQQQQEVNSYGWVDQRLRVVRIPVDQAMDLVLKNGLPIAALGTDWGCRSARCPRQHLREEPICKAPAATWRPTSGDGKRKRGATRSKR